MTRIKELVLEPYEASHAPQRLIGQKTEGLLRLPSQWRPPFIVLSSQLISAFRDCIARHGAAPEDCLSKDITREILSVVERFATEEDYIILRSSSALEGVEQRGAFDSRTCKANWPSILESLREVTTLAPHAEDPLAVLVQKFVSIKRASGHLSNERRVSQRRTTWLWELDTVSGVGSANYTPFSSVGVEPLGEADDLACRNRDDLVLILQRLAAWGSKKDMRLHFEWIWDGSRLWVVQADGAPEVRGVPPAAAFHGRVRPKPVSNLQTLEREVDVVDESIHKIECVRIFRRCSLPTADLWILRKAEIMEELRYGNFPDSLEGDLIKLIERPIVIRTDIRRTQGGEAYLLPRSPTITDLKSAKDFLIQTCAQTGSPDAINLVFIFHRFIPARSSAFSMAEPQGSRVRVDGLWGLPDGLLYYPHDSFELSSGSGSIIERKVRYKDEYLDPDENGSWKPRSAGAPWDWKASLEDEELRLIAAGTRRLSDELNRPVQVMWFVGVPPQTGHPSCLPWFYDTEEPPKGLNSRRRSYIAKDVFVVRRREDVRELQRVHVEKRPVSLIAVRPMPDLLRDKSFLEEITEVAKSLGVPIELEGSVLSHAYYILRRSGVSLLVPEDFSFKEGRRKFGKLVRDRIPDKIARHGETAVAVRISGESLTNVLRAKVVEEALELFWADSIGAAKEEFVDIQTALDAYARHEGFDPVEIKGIYEEKAAARGGFDLGIVLQETIDSPVIGDEPRPSLFGEARSASAEEITSTPHLEGPHLVVPLVPPSPERRHLGYVYSFPSLGVALNIRYREKEVVIEVSRLTSTKEDGGQIGFDFGSSGDS